MQTIWITGAGGLLGNSLVQSAPEFVPVARLVGLTRAQLDLTDARAVREAFARQTPQLVIHCAAMTRNPECQAEPARARRVNLEATALLAELAAEIPFVFFSTDLVFDGRAGHYDEAAAVNPLSVYAETKAQAEQVVLANHGHTVIRTSLNGGISPTGDRGFNEQLRAAWRSGQTVRLFTDEFRSPIAAAVTARAVWEIVLQNRPGLYHVAGSERLSRWQIGRLLAARWPELQPKIAPASLREYQGPPRAPDTSLDCAKVQRLLSFPLPGFTGWLAAQPPSGF
jgi:dTDP-4-dehydrorhamnose reductase